MKEKSNFTLKDELKIIEKCKNGNIRLFDKLMHHYQNRIFGLAMEMLGNLDAAQEVAEEAFVKAFLSIKNFREEAKFSTWLTAIVLNLCRQRRRFWARNKQRIAGSIDAPFETLEGKRVGQVAAPGPNPKEKAMTMELRNQLSLALRSLDKQSRAIIVMRDIQGYSYKKIANALGCPQGTIKSRLNRTRLRLKKTLIGTFSSSRDLIN